VDQIVSGFFMRHLLYRATLVADVIEECGELPVARHPAGAALHCYPVAAVASDQALPHAGI
jgi:hypothetical protein